MAVVMTKETMWANLQAPSLDQALAFESRTQMMTRNSGDAAEPSLRREPRWSERLTSRGPCAERRTRPSVANDQRASPTELVVQAQAWLEEQAESDRGEGEDQAFRCLTTSQSQ
jgi:hypothetical protein